MSDAIQSEMRAIIEKNLPAEVGKTLQIQLARLATLEKTTVEQDNKIYTQDAKNKDLQEKLAKAGNLENREKQLNEKEALLKEEQRNLDHKLEIAALYRDNATRIKDEIKSIVELVFCSPVTKKRVQENTTDYGNDYDSQGRNITKNTSGTKTVEEDTTGPNLQG